MNAAETNAGRAGAASIGRRPSRLLVVSHVVHYDDAGQLSAYGPYAREIDIWADLFETIVIAAPLRRTAPPGDCVPFSRRNISVCPQRDAGGDTWQSKVGLLLALPLWVIGLTRAMRSADAIHVRCPGNLGLVGAALAPLFSRHLIAKYAGQWNGYAGESLPTRLQRYLLGSKWWHGPVTVYGNWPDRPSHVVPFFTSMMTTDQVKRAVDVAAVKRIGQPLRVLFSGTLEVRKRVDALIEAIGRLADDQVAVELAIVGDGPQRAVLEAQAASLTKRGLVKFVGALPYDESLHWFEWAHVLVLPSRHSEGWPKVIAEGMCHGVLCLGVAHGQVPNMLAGRGILLASGSSAEIAEALHGITREPSLHLPAMRAASDWARQYSLDGLRSALAALLATRWNVAAAPGPSRERAAVPLPSKAKS